MIPAAFDYKQAASADEALSLLAEYGDEAKLLAGGHSLLPLMKLRLAQPEVLIDIGEVRDLSYVNDGGDHVAVGALTRHRDVERSELLTTAAPLLAHAAGHVGDPQVRNRGTLGGSLVHGDPASDLPAVALASGATMVVRGPSGQREIAAADFFTGFLETAVQANEMLVEIKVPKVAGKGWSFAKFNQRSQDWSVVGTSVQQHDDGVRIGLVNMDSVPVRARASEDALNGGASIEDAAALAADGLNPPADDSGSSEYRASLAVTILEDALKEAMA